MAVPAACGGCSIAVTILYPEEAALRDSPVWPSPMLRGQVLAPKRQGAKTKAKARIDGTNASPSQVTNNIGPAFQANSLEAPQVLENPSTVTAADESGGSDTNLVSKIRDAVERVLDLRTSGYTTGKANAGDDNGSGTLLKGGPKNPLELDISKIQVKIEKATYKDKAGYNWDYEGVKEGDNNRALYRFKVSRDGLFGKVFGTGDVLIHVANKQSSVDKGKGGDRGADENFLEDSQQTPPTSVSNPPLPPPPPPQKKQSSVDKSKGSGQGANEKFLGDPSSHPPSRRPPITSVGNPPPSHPPPSKPPPPPPPLPSKPEQPAESPGEWHLVGERKKKKAAKKEEAKKDEIIIPDCPFGKIIQVVKQVLEERVARNDNSINAGSICGKKISGGTKNPLLLSSNEIPDDTDSLDSILGQGELTSKAINLRTRIDDYVVDKKYWIWNLEGASWAVRGKKYYSESLGGGYDYRFYPVRQSFRSDDEGPFYDAEHRIEDNVNVHFCGLPRLDADMNRIPGQKISYLEKKGKPLPYECTLLWDRALQAG